MLTQSVQYRVVAVSALSLLLSSCSDGPITPPVAHAAPVLLSAAGRVAPENALSAKVAYTATAGDSVRFVYLNAAGRVDSTPYRVARSGVDTIVVLGLRASTAYH